MTNNIRKTTTIFLAALLIAYTWAALASNELQHTDVGPTISKVEWEDVETHIIDSFAEGDILYVGSDGIIYRLALGTQDTILKAGAALPSWENTIWQLTGTVLAPTTATLTMQTGPGTAAAPAWSFTDDDNTGAYRSANDEITIVTGGIDGLTINAARDAILAGSLFMGPQLRIAHTPGSKFLDIIVDTNHDATFKPSSVGQLIFIPTTDSIDFFQVFDADGGTPVLNVDTTNERLGIKILAPEADVHLAGSPSQITKVILDTHAASSSRDTRIELRKSLSDDPTTNTETNDGNFLGRLTFIGVDTTNNREEAAMIRVAQDGAAGARVPGEIQWRLATATVAVVTKMILRSDGKWGLGTETPDNMAQIVGDLKVGDDNTNYVNIGTTGDVTFVGGAGMTFGGIGVVENAVETAITTATVKAQVTIFDTNAPSNNTTPDHTTDDITIVTAGSYLIVCSATVNSVGGAGSVLELEIMKNNGASRLGKLHADRTISGGGTERASISLSDIVTLAASDTVEVWIENETNTQNYIVEDMTVVLTQLGG